MASTGEKIKAHLRIWKARLVQGMVKLLWVLPMQKDVILFLSFDGKQYSDSPKYICDYIFEKEGANKKYIWALNEPEKFAGILPEWCQTVKRKGFGFLVQFVKSGTVITNNSLYSFYPVRKKQIVLNTWHGGSPLKTCGLANEASTYYDELFFKLHEGKYTAFLSSSEFMTKEVFEKSLGYHGEVLPFGMPRNALFFGQDNGEIKNKVYQYFGCSLDEKHGLVLYAPTFRGSANNGTFLKEEDMIDVDRLLSALKNRFGKDFCLLFRAHHAMHFSLQNENVKLATDYPDMQELLESVDVLITDYSSCMGDMALTRKPVFLYTPDLEDYTRDCGFYWSIYDQPFPVATSNAALEQNILGFSLPDYDRGLDEYFEKLGSFESGESTAKTYLWLKDRWQGKHREAANK